MAAIRSDLSLGFNAGSAIAATEASITGQTWPISSRSLHYNIPPEMAMLVIPRSIHQSQHETINRALDPIMPSNVGVVPLLPMEDQEMLASGRIKMNEIQLLWQNQNANIHHDGEYHVKNGVAGNNASGFVGRGSDSSGSTCQDCGNQAKKDCCHKRCRTCCKSRGFDCNTHVRSTWVPAARRRERQLMAAATCAGGGAGSSGSTSDAKKPRLVTSHNTNSNTSTSNNTSPPRSFDISSHHRHQDGTLTEALPGQIRASAIFKCVRMTAMEDGEDEYAYQAIVKIGGHVFKGFLYDQGIQPRDGFPNISELHLGSDGGGGARNGLSSSSPILDPHAVYGATAVGGMLGGSNYANPSN